jgi:response regulator RpfG family c-di-GMP phosphodiesterase
VVDDEKVIREILSDFLTMEGFLVRTVEDGESAVAELQRRVYNLVITDLKMPKLGGLELLAKINELCPDVLTVIMTGFGTVETAIEAMKNGAYDYILKPFKVEEVVHIVRRGLDRQQLQLENIRLRETLSLYKISEAISQSLSLEQVLDLILEATAGEVNADAVTLLLQADTDQQIRTYRNRKTGDTDLGELNLNEIQRFFEQELPLLAHGSKAHRFFTRPPQSERLVSLCTIPLVSRQEFVGVLCAYSFTRGLRFTEGQRKVLSILGSRASVSIENARLYENLLFSNKELAGAKQSLEENFRQTIVAFAHALDESDRYTRGHSERVATYARLIAQQLDDIDDSGMDTIVLAAELHDIGKIGIPTEKLNKPGPLSKDEMELLRTHPDKGKRILEPIPFLRRLIPGVYCHHENWDGGGYPQGLKGEGIPLVGRIVAVADSYDAMTTDRAYRRALPHDVAVSELEKGSGTQFDPQIVEIFLSEIQRLKKSFRNTQPIELPQLLDALSPEKSEEGDADSARKAEIAAAAG